MITKEQFETYEQVRVNGRTNMLDLTNVSILSGLTKVQVKHIIENYDSLCKEFPGVRE